MYQRFCPPLSTLFSICPDRDILNSDAPFSYMQHRGVINISRCLGQGLVFSLWETSAAHGVFTVDLEKLVAAAETERSFVSSPQPETSISPS
jgi:hypothetical protein